MADASISEEDIFRTTLSSVTEIGHCTLAVESVNIEEKISMNRASEEMDIDYFMMKETCSVLLSKQPVVNLLADFSAEFFPRPFKERIYSATVKEILSFGKIGDYKIGIVIKEKGHTEPIFDGEEENLDENLDDITQNVSYKFIHEKLQVINYTWLRGHSFLNMKDLLVEHFGELVLVIYKYGQKAPHRQLSARIISIFSDAGIPVEMALGKQYKLENYFLSAKLINEYRSYAFSNFLSNEMCNIRINNPTYAKTIAPNCYRMTLYNSLQHYKKDIDFSLTKQANATSCSLNQFQHSFAELDDKLKILSGRLPSTELRMELYFSITTMAQYNDAIHSMRSLITSFQIVKKDVVELTAYFRQRRKLLKAFFSHSKDFDDAKSLYFLFFYDKYIKFIDSSQLMTDKFLKSNCGLYIPERWLDKTSKLFTKFFYDDWTIVQVWNALKKIFDGRNDSLTVSTYYLFQYIQHFYRFIECDQDQLNYAVERIGNLLIDKETVKSSQLTWETSTLPMQPIFRLMLQKHSKNFFLKAILLKLVDFSVSTTIFLLRLEELLIKADFTVPLNNVLHSIAKDGYVTSDPTSYPKLLAFVQRTDFNEFILAIQSRPRPSGAQFLKDLSYTESLLAAFRREIRNCEKHFLGSSVVPIMCKFSVEYEVFLSFLLNNVAVDLTGVSNEMRKAASYFFNFPSFSLYLYAGLWKYYLSEMRIPDVLKSYILNTLCCREYKKGSNNAMKNKRMTLSKIFYFTGRFDRKGTMEGLFLPADCRTDLMSRLGKPSHRQLSSSTNSMMSLAGPNVPTQVFANQHQYVFPDTGYDSDLLIREVELPSTRRNSTTRVEEFGGEDFPFDDEFINSEEFMNLTRAPVPTTSSPVVRNIPIEDLFNNTFRSSVSKPVFTPDLFSRAEHHHSMKRLALEHPPPQIQNKYELADTKQTPTLSLSVAEEVELIDLAAQLCSQPMVPQSFESKLCRIFPESQQKTFISTMVKQKITEEKVIQATEEELEEYLVTMCKMSRIISGAIAGELKYNFK